MLISGNRIPVSDLRVGDNQEVMNAHKFIWVHIRMLKYIHSLCNLKLKLVQQSHYPQVIVWKTVKVT